MSKSDHRVQDRVEVNMTPMIDVVFQLLTFFLMTFKVASVEGDFNVRMPLTSLGGVPPHLPPIQVRLEAEDDGGLHSLLLGDQDLGTGPSAFAALHREIRGIVGQDTGPGSFASQLEVEMHCDPELHYINVVNAISSVSGYVDASGTVFKLIEKVKFSPPRPKDPE